MCKMSKLSKHKLTKLRGVWTEWRVCWLKAQKWAMKVLSSKSKVMRKQFQSGPNISHNKLRRNNNVFSNKNSFKRLMCFKSNSSLRTIWSSRWQLTRKSWLKTKWISLIRCSSALNASSGLLRRFRRKQTTYWRIGRVSRKSWPSDLRSRFCSAVWLSKSTNSPSQCPNSSANLKSPKADWPKIKFIFKWSLASTQDNKSSTMLA